MRDHLGNPLFCAHPEFARGIHILEDFDVNNQWTATGEGATLTCTTSSDAAYYGDKGLKLGTDSDSPAENDWISAIRYFPFPQAPLLVARGRLMMPDASDIASIILSLNVHNAAADYLWALKLEPATPAVKYLASGGTYTTITEMTGTPIDNQWLDWEIVADLSAFTYVSARFNGITKDLDGIACRNQGASSYRFGSLSLRHATGVAFSRDVYHDTIYVGEFLNL